MAKIKEPERQPLPEEGEVPRADSAVISGNEEPPAAAPSEGPIPALRRAGRARRPHAWRLLLVASVVLFVTTPLLVYLPPARQTGQRDPSEAVRPVAGLAVRGVEAPGMRETPTPPGGAHEPPDPPRKKTMLELMSGGISGLPLVSLLMGCLFSWSAYRVRDSRTALIIHGLMMVGFGILLVVIFYQARAAARAVMPGDDASAFGQYADVLAAGSALILIAAGVNVYTHGLLMQDGSAEVRVLAAELRLLREDLRRTAKMTDEG